MERVREGYSTDGQGFDRNDYLGLYVRSVKVSWRVLAQIMSTVASMVPTNCNQVNA